MALQYVQEGMLIRTLAVVLLSFPALWAGVPDAKANPARDIVFDVYRNGSAFGEHAVSFDEDADGTLRVRTDIELRAGLGPITVFHYEHDAVEVWRDGELVSLSAQTVKDGERERVALSGAELPELPPSSHWRGYDPEVSTILNTETGEPMSVHVSDLGLETIETESGPVEARRIRMAGTLTVDLWYDRDGRWVGCEFEARGQSIRYVLRDS